jgi:Protein of unknown function (DUF1116)
MAAERDLLRDQLGAVVVGPDLFAAALVAQGLAVQRVDWQPTAAADALASLWCDEVDTANRIALDRLLTAHQILVDVRPAIEVVPDMTRETVLHAGPPIAWERMSGPLRGGIVGALIYEGLAATWEDAERLVTRGAVRFDPCHHHATVGPMAGATTASMPVLVVENRTAGNRAYSTINEGLGKVLRYGAYAPDVIDRLRWFRDVVGPAFGEAIRRAGGIDLRALIGQAVQMGDECHNRNRAASALLIKALAPEVAALELPAKERRRILAFAASNEHLFLNVGMAACKAALDAAHGVSDSTIVTAMARNGTEFGIRVGGLGDRWFTGPAQTPQGLYFPGFGAGDANPDIGDSAITETAGLGGFAMGGAPAVVQFVGGTPADALEYTRLMYEITLGESTAYRLPALDFRGTPTGIDVRLVVQTGILPQIDTGMAHREPGVGQVGAGLVKPPRECFDRAFEALVRARADAAARSTSPRS